MLFDSQEKRVRSNAAEPIFWLFAAAALFMFLGRNALWGSEDRWAEITREMMLTGDYLHPAINWRMYFDKPQLSYWFIVPWARLFGLDELAVRIPSALAALAGLFGTMKLAERLFGRDCSFLSGWMLLSCYGYLFWGRTAAADMANTAAVVLAVAWFLYLEEKPAFWKYLVFYLIVFCGALTKGLPAVAVPAVMLCWHLLNHKRWLKHLNFANFFALVLGAAVYLTPFLAASHIPPAEGFLQPAGEVLTGLELVWRENIVRAFNAFDHKDPFFSYFYNLPRILLPWSPFFAAALVAAAASWKRLEEPHRELFIGILLVFVMFSCSTSRRWYYILPLAPFCVILTSEMICRCREEKWARFLVSAMRWLVIFAASLALAAPVMLPVFSMLFHHVPPLLAVTAVPVAGLAALFVCVVDQKPGNGVERFSGLPPRLASTVTGTAILMAAVFGAVVPSLTFYRTEKPFIRSAVPLLAGIPEKDIAFYDTDSAAKFQFYMNWNGPAAVIWKKRGDLEKFIESRRGRKIAVICYGRKRELAALESDLAGTVLGKIKLVPVQREPGKGKKWVIFLFDVPPGGTETKTEPAASRRERRDPLPSAAPVQANKTQEKK
ncbi:MAG: glycosyltransferase family 39 protein [Lentisphaeria bacterium]|nr:glycosyltransferase family 39 protein [Lentisphaeria bacterium]